MPDEPKAAEVPEVIVVEVEKGNAPAMITVTPENAAKMDTFDGTQ
jgi:hypothetical protein